MDELQASDEKGKKVDDTHSECEQEIVRLDEANGLRFEGR